MIIGSEGIEDEKVAQLIFLKKISFVYLDLI